jgi:hypothetical protein
LVGYWLARSDGFVNLCGGPDLLAGAAATRSIRLSTSFGHANGMDTSSRSVPSYSLSAPTNLQLTDRVSLMWAGNVGTGNTNNCRLLSMEFNSTSSTPFVSYGIYQNASGQVTAAINSAGSFSTAGPATATNGSDNVAFLTYNRTTLSLRYGLGAPVTASLSGAITYGSGPRLVIGNVASVVPLTGAVMAVGAIWSRALSTAEQDAMYADPFQVLRS